MDSLTTRSPVLAGEIPLPLGSGKKVFDVWKYVDILSLCPHKREVHSIFAFELSDGGLSRVHAPLGLASEANCTVKRVGGEGERQGEANDGMGEVVITEDVESCVGALSRSLVELQLVPINLEMRRELIDCAGGKASGDGTPL